jgi:hypothetical protein
LHTSTSAEGEFVHMKAPPILIRGIGTQSHRWRGAQHHIAIGPDPIPMPMAVEHKNTRGVGGERVQDVWCIDQRETNPLVQELYKVSKEGSRVTLRYRQDLKALYRCAPTEYFVVGVEK